jgi:hypothetical protein
MGITLVLFALFLLVLTAVAFSAVRLFSGRGPDGKRDAAGCLTGCAVGLGLFVLGGLGLGALIAALIVQSASVAMSHNPVKEIYLGTRTETDGADAQRTPLSGFAQDPARPLHLVFEIEGHDASPGRLLEWIREWSDGQATVRSRNELDAEGRPVTRIDVALPVRGRELLEIEREVRKLLPDVNWDDGLRIEFKGASREG